MNSVGVGDFNFVSEIGLKVVTKLNESFVDAVRTLYILIFSVQIDRF